MSEEISLPAEQLVARVRLDQGPEALCNGRDLETLSILRVIKLFNVLGPELASRKTKARQPFAIDPDFRVGLARSDRDLSASGWIDPNIGLRSQTEITILAYEPGPFRERNASRWSRQDEFGAHGTSTRAVRGAV